MSALGITEFSDEDADDDSFCLSTENDESDEFGSLIDLSENQSIFPENENSKMDLNKVGTILSGEPLKLKMLDEPRFLSNQSAIWSRRETADQISYYGDPISMEQFDEEDKCSRKKSLRFHAAKIDNMRPRHGDARHSRGGDDDITYPIRGVRGSSASRPEINGSSLNIAGSKRQREHSPDSSNREMELDVYYDLVKRKKRALKDKVKEAYDAGQISLR